MRIWIAHYHECYHGFCDSAAVVIRAPDEESAAAIAKTWSESVKIKLLSLEEFTNESVLVDAHYS